MAKKSNFLFLILIIVGAIYTVNFFTTTGEFTELSTVIDDFGEFWFSGSPLNIVKTGSVCHRPETPCRLNLGVYEDETNKFKLITTKQPFVDANNKGVLTIPEQFEIAPTAMPSWDIQFKNDIRGKDIKAIMQFGEPKGCQLVGTPFNNLPTIQLVDVNSGLLFEECSIQRELSPKDFHVIEWRSSNLQKDFGALFVNGIKVCEKQLSKETRIRIKVDPIQGRNCQQQEIWSTTPETKIWAIGQRLPFNCRIDPTHEAFFVETFSGNKIINLQSFAFSPIAFCKDSPLIRVSPLGITSTTESFLRWAEGKSLQVPENEVWLTTYVADWKAAGLSSGCGATDRYLVNESRCESEARIVVAEQTIVEGTKTITTTSSGKVIEQVVSAPNKEVITLEKTKPLLPRGLSLTAIIIIALAVVVVLFLIGRDR